MNDDRTFSVSAATTDADIIECMRIRHSVFVTEQEVPLVLEVDARDQLEATAHVIARLDSGQVVGAGRMLPNKEATFTIGRLAVLPAYRGRGIGRGLVAALVQTAHQSLPGDGGGLVYLDAQVHAIGFYSGLGFVPTKKPVFVEAGIDHQQMVATLEAGDESSSRSTER